VERILAKLDLKKISLIRVLNKQDLVDGETASILTKVLDGTAVSANIKSTLTPLIERIEKKLINITH
jgi:50S ribosomal subunit-associated GTPase HflX